jgi:integrin beta 3
MSIQGERGAPGLDGKDGRDGINGKDGKDALSLDSFDAEVAADGRTIVLRLGEGEFAHVHELKLAVMIYRGVFKEGSAYERGDTVTWGGSLWHCDAETADKPGEGAKAWTLAAKRGRDGRDGKDGAPGPRGQDGPKGRDLTQLGFDGGKH